MALPAREASDLSTALQDAVAQCMRLPLVHPMTRMDALHAAMNTLLRAGSGTLHLLNDAAPVNRVPDDLLARIIFYAALDAASASRICRRWRSVLTSVDFRRMNTEYWFTEIDGFASVTGSRDNLVVVLVPVKLAVARKRDARRCLLRQHLVDVRRLCIHAGPGLEQSGERPSSVRHLVQSLEEPAPMLEVLELSDSYHIRRGNRRSLVSEYTFLSEALLARSAARLHTLCLRGLALHDRTYPALAGLRRLCLLQPEVDLAHVLAFYPKLEQLYIDATSLVSSDQEITSNSLKVLHIPGTKQAAEIVCKHLVLARPLMIWADMREDQLLDHVLNSVPARDARLAKFLFNADSMQSACVMTYASGLTWVVELWRHFPYESLAMVELMASIAGLAIHELEWPQRPLEIPPAPNVTRLELILYRPQADADLLYSLSGIFSERDSLCCVLECPALEELSILSPTLPAMTVDVFDVLDFLSRQLRFAEGPLPCLTLRNVCVCDPTWGRGMELLTARVRRVEYSEFSGPDIPYIHQKNGSMSWVYSMMA
ncbi:hypothetical protein AURDEDRAFT_151337 [Auricularia subglabra TFB-10046 SS5]|nr:hypothetical protein AURDEDRAFT_151337 [Auricularia subglabra TFB-10046 SS5]